jgi:hypothetical protein
MPPGAFPPPPPYYPYDNAHLQYPPPQYGPQYGRPYGAPAPANGLAIGSLVSSLVGIPGYFLCFGFVGSILGIVLGIVALNQIGKSGQTGKGMAVAGIVLGALGLVGMGLISLLVASPSLWS